MNSVEPYLAQLVSLDLFHAGQDWAAGARPAAGEMVLERLRDLDDWLDGRTWLAGGFSAADI